jgi:hypothetical protein
MRKRENKQVRVQYNQSYDVSCHISYKRYKIMQYNTYMVENFVVVFLLTDDSRRNCLASLGNVFARFLELPCGDFKCMDPTY